MVDAFVRPEDGDFITLFFVRFESNRAPIHLHGNSSFISKPEKKALPEFPYQQAHLKDPLSQETRKERRSLLAGSALGLIIVKAGLVPTKIAALGIEFSQADRTTLLRSLALITVYFLVAFIFYALADYSSYRIDTYILELRYHQRRKELLEVISDGLRSENEELVITKNALNKSSKRKVN